MTLEGSIYEDVVSEGWKMCVRVGGLRRAVDWLISDWVWFSTATVTWLHFKKVLLSRSHSGQIHLPRTVKSVPPLLHVLVINSHKMTWRLYANNSAKSKDNDSFCCFLCKSLHSPTEIVLTKRPCKITKLYLSTWNNLDNNKHKKNLICCWRCNKSAIDQDDKCIVKSFQHIYCF